MADGPKERMPVVVKRPSRGNAYAKRPPIRPFGTRYEFWSGVVGLSRDLSLHDAEMVAAYVDEIPARDRQVLARYMIALWKRFEAGK